MRIPFIGTGIVGSTNQVDMQIRQNWYIEGDSKDTRSPKYLIPTDGATKWCTVGSGPITNLYFVPGSNILLVVSGTAVYKVAPNGTNSPTITLLTTGAGGNVASVAAQRFTICDNVMTGGNQVFLAGYNNLGNAYVYNTSTNIIAARATNSPSYCTYQDTYGIYIKNSSQLFFVTASDDFTTDPAGYFAQLQSTSGVLQAVKSDNTRLYIFGQSGLEVWYNSGNSLFPFSRIAGAIYPIGCQAPFSIQKIDNSMVWLGVNEFGGPRLFQMRGENPPMPISTPQLEQLWYNLKTGQLGYYYTNTSDIWAFVYEKDGHEFYVLQFGTAPANGGQSGTYNAPMTFVWDASNNTWHTRATRSTFAGGGTFNGMQWFPTAYCFSPLTPLLPQYAGDHVVGDASGNLYVLDRTNATDNTTPIDHVLITPHVNDENQRTFISSIELILGQPNNATLQPNQAITLQYLKNGAYGGILSGPYPISSFGSSLTYTTPVTSPSAQTVRCMFRRLGWARDWVFQVSTTSPLVLMDGFADVMYRTDGAPPKP